MRHWRRFVLVILALSATVAAAAFGWRQAYRAGRVGPIPTGRDGVIFIITDNVRVDHTSLCGYQRPTTPTLVAMAAEPGAIHSCRAYAPGSWTLPSHASYFTGKPVLEHGAHEYAGKVNDPHGTSIVTHKLDKSFPTLAITFRKRGYQTALWAGNPVVGKSMGLSRGFEHVHTAKKFGTLERDDIARELRELLRSEFDPLGGPLFLTVNLAEAHRPWKPIPSGHAFLPRRGRLQFRNEPITEEWPQFLTGAMPDAQARKYLRQIRDVYDYGVERADDGVREIVEVVREEGWCGGDCRIVVTSDHGEFIGEHGLIDHGFYTWEENAGVYLLAQGTEATSLPEPVSAMVAYWLVRDGKLPKTLPAVEQAAWPHMRRYLHSAGKAFGSTSVARWTDFTKLMWMDGRLMRFDLAADPDETSPLEAAFDADFDELVERVKQAGRSTDEVDMDVMEALKAAGYEE